MTQPMTSGAGLENKTSLFFTPLANTKPYFKAAFQGFAGSGKTYTAAQVAVGLHQRIKSTKPVIIFDTEKAAKFLKPVFADNKIEVLVKESRSLADLQQTMKLMREGASDVLIIDSISHVWENFLQSYMDRKNRTRLEFQDWGVIKPTWKREFSDPFVRDPYHIVMTGRAGYEYESEINSETQKREIYKSGVKMKVEGETAYEPDLLVSMERFENILGDKKEVWREATVLKDRSISIDGKTFKNPTYENFKPAIEIMLESPETAVLPAERDASELIKTEEDNRQWRMRRDIALEKIENYLISIWPGQDAKSKKLKVDSLQWAFGSSSWTEISHMQPEKLEQDFGGLEEFMQLQIEAEKQAAGVVPMTGEEMKAKVEKKAAKK